MTEVSGTSLYISRITEQCYSKVGGNVCFKLIFSTDNLFSKIYLIMLSKCFKNVFGIIKNVQKIISGQDFSLEIKATRGVKCVQIYEGGDYLRENCH